MSVMNNKISEAQLRTLQTLYGLYARSSLESGADVRAERLAWASKSIGRTVASFSGLRGDEAARLIGTLKQSLGQESAPPVRRRRSREAALAAGTHGRKNCPANIEMLATREDIEEVEQMSQRLGMTRENFKLWLKSRSSPIGGRAMPELRTIADCNRVRWALKAMLKRAS